MIYCVVPHELEEELFDRLVAYYGDKPDVTVVVDRRAGGDRRGQRGPWEQADNRQPGNRRRSGPGGFVSTNVRDP